MPSLHVRIVERSNSITTFVVFTSIELQMGYRPRHSSAHFRHCLAHSAMTLSSLCFSHSVAHWSQAVAQAAAIVALAGPRREEILRHVPQISAQSRHAARQAFTPLPSANKSMQCATHSRHASSQSSHSSAHFGRGGAGRGHSWEPIARQVPKALSFPKA